MRITFICFGVGLFTVSLFGVDFKAPYMDYDLIILLGVIVFLAIFVIICFLIQYIKKAFLKKHK